ncbi:hypothetical protein FIBSPDRAFT_481019 [Athelia psychrophila]|uniref:Uncharacterized protein n=1 Tax=Athelia psychrophila TaxID=1759441 RepID=A0A166VEY2_9AGAM|nr:hypothetical protein FIBSPDRAFT_481019 [Fibularhizoctonia sp. CBS 109695]
MILAYRRCRDNPPAFYSKPLFIARFCAVAPRSKLSQGLTMDAGEVAVYRIRRDSMAQW